MGALIMLGSLFSVIAVAFGLVLRYDPEARGPVGKGGGQP